jgi:transcriptional regulator of acetoin/glycerol metabolism
LTFGLKQLQPCNFLLQLAQVTTYRDGQKQGAINAILAAMDAANGNQTKAAKTLKMRRETLWRKVKQYKIRFRGYVK